MNGRWRSADGKGRNVWGCIYMRREREVEMFMSGVEVLLS
jgi:hypothetical protein